MSQESFESHVRSALAQGRESEWVEYKQGNSNHEIIGQNISAIANGAALHKKSIGYIIWGVQDDGSIVGTQFDPCREKIKGQELENWLVTQLEPKIDVIIEEGHINGAHIVLFRIQPASSRPVRFKGTAYIRIGSYTKRLTDHPEKERQLWALFSTNAFEKGVARQDITSDDVLRLIDYPEYFRLMDQSLPDNREGIFAKLQAEKIIYQKDGDHYDISNVGAILFARSLHEFDLLSRKALRIVIYRGENKAHTIKEQLGIKGYASGFEGAISYINDQLPQNEQVEQALRRQVGMFPEIAIRELVANALIHQDFNTTGTGPMIEIYSDRMEITNPGIPLIDTLRFIDIPPQSRNEALASLMRRMNICEERGGGIDKVIIAVEAFQSPPPDFRTAGDNTIVVLYAPRKFAQMNREERIRACYQHACLMSVSSKRITNASLRVRLGIKDSNYPQASKIIKDAIESGFIKPHGEGGSKKDASYVPFWA